MVAVFDFEGEKRRAEKVLEGVDDAVQELEDQQGLNLGGRGGDEQQVGVGEAEDERGRARVGQVYQVRSRRRVLEVEGQQAGGRERSPRVPVRQQRASAERSVGVA